MAALIRPHGSDELQPLLLVGADREAELARAADLPQWTMSSRETGDVIMLGIGGFTPLAGFMTQADWDGVCREMKTASGVFWPIPVTLSVSQEFALELPGVFQGIPLILIAALLTWLLLLAIGSQRKKSIGDDPYRQALYVATIIALGIGLHNLGEGLAIGVSKEIHSAYKGRPPAQPSE